MIRQVVLDTETTGLQPEHGDRIVEIGCVEMVDREVTGKTFHKYLNPEKEMDHEVIKIHGLDNAFLADKPLFSEIVDEFLDFVKGAELVIHNAPFDIGFINHELTRQSKPSIDSICTVVDTLIIARAKHPGAKVNLDALCRRYQIDNSARVFHGALLDSEILAEVYLRLTGGQVALSFDSDAIDVTDNSQLAPIDSVQMLNDVHVIPASLDDQNAHKRVLEAIDEASQEGVVWSTD